MLIVANFVEEDVAHLLNRQAHFIEAQSSSPHRSHKTIVSICFCCFWRVRRRPFYWPLLDSPVGTEL